MRNNPHKKLWTARGCPFRCSYCFNSAYKELYKGLGKTVRQRTVGSVIDELRELKQFGWKCLEFVDDHFLLSEAWVYEFAERYAKEIGMPFSCFSAAKQVKPDVVKALKHAGCTTLCFAIESGVERIRREIYNKAITNEDIYKAADALHTHNMPFLTFNMIGLPDETMEDIYETIKLNTEIKTTYPWCSILQPYPGTPIAEYIKQQGYATLEKFTYSYFQESIIN